MQDYNSPFQGLSSYHPLCGWLLIGGRRAIVKQYPVLPSSLQNRIVVVGKRYGSIPSVLQQAMTFSFGRDILGYPQNPLTVPWPKLNNHKITLSFKPATTEDEKTLLSLIPEGEITDISQLPTSIPAYLINVIPELKVDGVVIKAGYTMPLGVDIDFGFDTQLVNRGVTPKNYTLPAGSFLSIAAIAGSVSAQVFSNLQTKLTETKNTLQTADPGIIGTLTREDILGDMFHAGSLGYYAQYMSLSHLSGLQAGAHYILAAGTGSFGYEPNVGYFFGIPRSLNPGGIALNKPLINIVSTNDGNSETKKSYVQQIGMLSSALEHITPEQMFTDANNPGEAVSAVKALQKAAQQGQRIYQITQQNMATALPNIHHNADTMDEIRNALNAGKVVTTHTDAIQVPGWTGAGYIIIDPETGVGVYKISGGANGGFLKKIAKALSTVATGFPLTKTVVLMIDIAFTISTIIDVVSKCGLSMRILVGITLLTALSAGIGAIMLSPMTLVGALYGGGGLISLSVLFGIQLLTSLWLDKLKESCK